MLADAPLLSLLIFIPLAGAALALFIPGENEGAIKGWATAVAAAVVPVVARIWAVFDPAAKGFQLKEFAPWVASLGISYHLGIDGVALALVALTAVVFLVATLASFGISRRVKEYFVLLMVLEAAVMGVFVTLDYILFYVFWEAVLIPMYFLIAIWGGARREYAAIKFLIYTMVGSLFMLVGILALYFKTGGTTFSIPEIAANISSVPETWRWWVFLAFFAGFGVKVPVWPLHTWLPDAHVEAPTPISVILAAVLLKMGTYGFIRISVPTLPEAARDFALAMAILGVINIIYGALAAMAQKDFKKLVAYSSVSHMGYVLIGTAAATPASLNGAVYQMVSHGIVAGMLFLLVGIWYDRTHTRELGRLGGMNVATPVAAVILTFAGMANLGLPGLSGFVAEFFTVLGAIDVFRTIIYVTLIGIVFTAAFNLLMLHRVVMGKPRAEFAVMPDASARELATLVPLMALTLLLGVWPSLVMDITNGPVMELVARLGGYR